MTAKEIAEETELLVLNNNFGKHEPKMLKKAIIEYARQKCKEQREILARYGFEEALDIPEPEIE